MDAGLRAAVAALVFGLSSCVSRQVGAPSYVGPAGPEPLECARDVLERYGWEASRLDGDASALEGERRERSGSEIAAHHVIGVRVTGQADDRRIEATPRSFDHETTGVEPAGRPDAAEVDPPESVTRLAALVVASCRTPPSGAATASSRRRLRAPTADDLAAPTTAAELSFPRPFREPQPSGTHP